MINIYQDIDYTIEKPKEIGFSFIITCYIFALATNGFGDLRLGIFNETFSTYFIYIVFLFQIFTGTLRFPKILLWIYLYIFIQSYILNILNINIISSAKHFLGFIIFSLSVFSFFSVYRNRILDIVQIYYRFAITLASIVFLQTILFVFFNISFKPQQILFGSVISNGNSPFEVEILGIFPRAIGLSTEPAHYAVLMLPGVYLALLALSDKSAQLKLGSKKAAIAILFGFILSFSLVGYFGLLLCLISIFANNLKGKVLIKSFLAILFSALIYIVSLSNLMFKLNVLPEIFNGGGQTYNYTTSDLSAFALASNLFVTQAALKKSNYLGTGFNTHKDSYDKEVYKIFSQSQIIMELNRTDAGSLLLRLLSEFGVPGILLFFYFLFHFWIRKVVVQSPLKYINNMSLIMIFSYSLRNGGYIEIYFIFFMALSYYTFKLAKQKLIVK